MAFDQNGNILVTDFNNQRIQKFMLVINSCGRSISMKPKWIRKRIQHVSGVAYRMIPVVF
jgi:hypothetical protein